MNKYKLILISTLIGLFTLPLLAFHPIRFSPLDLYVVHTVLGGPKSLSIQDQKSKVNKSAKIHYNSKGQITKEEYFDDANKKEGESQLEYFEGKLIVEKLLNAQGKLLNRREYIYNNKQMVKMRVLNGQGAVQMEQIYRYNKNLLTSGQENNGEGMLTFEISYSGSQATAIKIRNEDKAVISMVYIKYNDKGLVSERIRVQDGQKHRYQYFYINDKIDHYILYENNEANKWEATKTTRFVY